MNCHSKIAAEIMSTTHWTWETTDSVTGKKVGKKNIINNYCIAIASNEPRCTSCHIGVGWADKTFDFNDKTKIDCLICHDTTGNYTKVPTGAGAPPATLDLTVIAQNAGTTTRENCGSCHFYGGGGDAVKHGDLDSTMANPTRETDVHMGGLNFTCQECHTHGTDKPHHFVGSNYSEAHPSSHLCESCHTATPAGHNGILNSHTDRVSCQACHIPAYARGGRATKMDWDWSTAGQKGPDGKDQIINDANGYPVYDTKKGSFVWQANVLPEYRWSNGAYEYVTLDDPVEPGSVLAINRLGGNKDDANARIVPVKRFTGLQPYDSGQKRLAIPHLFGSDANAFWKSYDWEKALAAGMAYAEQTYTGPVGFVETEMLWVQNHMVAPKEQALECVDCHSYNGRMNFAALGYDAEKAAQLQDKYGPDSFWSDAEFPLVNGFRATRIGYVFDEYYPMVFVMAQTSTWLYVWQEGATKNGFFAYDFGKGTWLWSGENLGGWYYHFAAGEWRAW